LATFRRRVASVVDALAPVPSASRASMIGDRPLRRRLARLRVVVALAATTTATTDASQAPPRG